MAELVWLLIQASVVSANGRNLDAAWRRCWLLTLMVYDPKIDAMQCAPWRWACESGVLRRAGSHDLCSASASSFGNPRINLSIAHRWMKLAESTGRKRVCAIRCFIRRSTFRLQAIYYNGIISCSLPLQLGLCWPSSTNSASPACMIADALHVLQISGFGCIESPHNPITTASFGTNFPLPFLFDSPCVRACVVHETYYLCWWSAWIIIDSWTFRLHSSFIFSTVYAPEYQLAAINRS